MEIRIAYHSSSDTLINRISELLKENGITAELNTETSSDKGDVHFTVIHDRENEIAHTLLDSSFVLTEQNPEY